MPRISAGQLTRLSGASAGPTPVPPATLCNCTVQQSVAKKCTNSSTIPDPCNGNINGTAINEADKAFALCVKLFESSTTTFVYNHACKSSFIDYTYGCFSQSDCVDGEVCVDFGTKCNNPVCAVEAKPSNCGKTFNCGLKQSCTSGNVLAL